MAMNKKNLFKIIVFIVILFTIFHVSKIVFNKKTNQKKVLQDLTSFSEGKLDIISAILKSNKKQSEFFNIINTYSNPVVLFDFDENPLVWNDVASFYKGKYESTYDIKDKGVLLGTIGVGDGNLIFNSNGDGKAYIIVFLILTFFVLLHLDSFVFNLYFLIEVLTVVFVGSYPPMLLYLPICSFLVFFKDRKLIENTSQYFHLVFHLLILYKLLNSEFNFFLIFSGSLASALSFWLILFLISSAFLYFSKIGKISYIILILSTFATWQLPILPLSIIIMKSKFKNTEFSGYFMQAIIFSLMTVCILYFSFYLQLLTLMKNKPLDLLKIEQEAHLALENYLNESETGEFDSLLDFVKKTGLSESKFDFEVAYFNNTGTINSVFTRGLPEMLSIPQEIVIEEVKTANKFRKVIGGTAKFKSGLLTLRVSADYFNLSYLKPESAFYSTFKVIDLDGDKKLKINFPSVFFVISDISYIAVLLLMIFLAVFSIYNKKFDSLFEKAVVRYFTGFALITIIVGGIVIFYSSQYVKESDYRKLKETSLKLKAIVDIYSDELSDNYLKWLGTLFDCNLSVYKNSVLVSSSNNLENPALLPFSYYFNICAESKDELISNFVKNGMFIKLDSQGFYCSVLQVTLNKFSASESRLGEISRLFFITILLMLFAAFIITRLFTGKIVSPILELVKSTDKISKGNYDIDIKYYENDELGQLTKSINHMAGSIKDNYDNLISLVENFPSAVALLDEFNQVVVSNSHFSQISEEVKTLALKISSKKGERHFINGQHYLCSSINLLNNSKVIIVEDISEVVKVSRLTVLTDMARKISHDIKNPLTPIKLNTEYLLSISKRQPEKLQEVIPKISENILNKINELKGISEAFSTLIKNEAIDNKSSFSLTNFLTSHLSSYPELEFTIMGEDVEVIGIELKLARVIGNLIENSVNFAVDKPTVYIKIEDKGEFAKVIYEDNGSGIPDENIENIFEPYFSTRDTGTGLGLFIVREFMEESGGSIKAVKSNEGARFELNFMKA